MINRFLYVEDGSVDIDLLEEQLAEDTKIIVYRQGAQVPILVELEKPAKDTKDDENENKVLVLNKDIRQLKDYIKQLTKVLSKRKQPKKVHDLISEIYEECGIE